MVGEQTGARHDRVSPIDQRHNASAQRSLLGALHVLAGPSGYAMTHSTSERGCMNTQNSSAFHLHFVHVAATYTDRLVQSQEASEVREWSELWIRWRLAVIIVRN